RVILYGSYARGDADANSDLDFLVIEPEVDSVTEEAVRLRRSLRDLRVPADVVVIDEDRAQRRAKVAGTMVERALREGRLLVAGAPRGRRAAAPEGTRGSERGPGPRSDRGSGRPHRRLPPPTGHREGLEVHPGRDRNRDPP